MKTATLTGGSLLLAASSVTNAFVPSTTMIRNKASTTITAEFGSFSPRSTRVFGVDNNNYEDDENQQQLELFTKFEESTQREHTSTPNPIVYQWFSKIMSNFRQEDGQTNQAALAAAALAMALTFMPLPSDAAMSGGRMGGSFSSRPSMSRPAPSSSYRGGGYGGGGYYSRPGITVAPYAGFGYSPFYAPPVIYGGPGIVTYGRGPGLFDLIFFGGFMFVLFNIVTGALGSATSSTSSFFDTSDTTSVLGPGTSVIKLSVAMEVPNRDDSNSILGVLGRLARTAKTDSRVGVQNLTSQVALEILRRKSSIVSASSSYNHFRDKNKAQREYQSKSVQERSKFENETVSKYGGVDYGSSNSLNAIGDGSKATMAVVTLVLAIDGDSTKIPTRIDSVADVEEALRKIASDSKIDDCLQSAEILWTPEDRTETLTLRDVVADYPDLRSI